MTHANTQSLVLPDPLGLVLGHAMLAIPFVVVTLMAVLKNYDERLDQAAQASARTAPAPCTT